MQLKKIQSATQFVCGLECDVMLTIIVVPGDRFIETIIWNLVYNIVWNVV